MCDFEGVYEYFSDFRVYCMVFIVMLYDFGLFWGEYSYV